MEEIDIVTNIDGKLFSDMIISAANNVANNKNELNALNVFPVPDGDTGTNMALTVDAVAKEVLNYKSDSVGEIAQVAASASLRGARGNSGVILSQLFRGLAKELKGVKTCDAKSFSQALDSGAKTAYKAVMQPTEGTILTVARESAMMAVESSQSERDIASVLAKTIDEAKVSLNNTPNLLPALKQANVVDAGGKGWLVVLEGMYSALTDAPVERADKTQQPMASSSQPSAAAQEKVPPKNIKYGYCTEFLIEKSNPDANVLRFRDSIKSKGDCMLVIDDDSIVKVHIHTNNPGYVIEQALKVGGLINIKIDNMRYQHQSIIENTLPEPEEYAMVAVGVGEGIAQILKDIGAKSVIEGGQTMNPSTQDILDAAEGTNAKNIFVFPNNKNIILTAEAAKELCDKNIIVVPTKSISQGISAMLAFKPNVTPEQNFDAMSDAIKYVKSGSVTYAVRSTKINDKKVSKGDILGMLENEIRLTGKNLKEVCFELIGQMVDDDSSIITVFYGKDVKKADADEMERILENSFSDCDIVMKSGGQPLYYYIISVE